MAVGGHVPSARRCASDGRSSYDNHAVDLSAISGASRCRPERQSAARVLGRRRRGSLVRVAAAHRSSKMTTRQRRGCSFLSTPSRSAASRSKGSGRTEMEFAERVECRCYASRTLLSEVFLRDDQPDAVATSSALLAATRRSAVSARPRVPRERRARPPPGCHYLPCSVAVTVPQLWHTSWNELRDRACFLDAAVDLHKRPTS